jgi:hypothetical protein
MEDRGEDRKKDTRKKKLKGRKNKNKGAKLKET